MKNWIFNLKVKKKLMYSFALLIIFMLAIGGIGLYNMFSIYSNVESIAIIHMPATDLLLQIDRDMQQALVAQRTMIFSVVGSENFSKLKDENNENITQAKERWGKYKALEHTPEELTLISQYESEREKWIDISYKIVGARDSDTPEGRIEAIELSLREGSESFEAAREIINKLTEVTEKNSTADIEESESSYSSALLLMIGGMGVVLLLSFISAFGISKNIGEPLVKASDMMSELRKGHLNTRIRLNSKDELGVLSEAMDNFADTLQEFTRIMYRVADGDLSVEAPMLDDKDEITPALNKIVYTLRSLNSETGTLTTAALDGKLDARGRTDSFKGGYRDIVQGINETLNAVIMPVKEGVSALEKLATGDLTVKITSTYKGDHQLIKNSINTVAESLCRTMQDVDRAVKATANSSGEISSSTEEMAAGAHEQSSQTSEVATAVEQMTKTIIETTRNATAAAENAKKAGEIAGIGGKAVEDTVEGMQRIAEVVQKSSETVKQLGRNSDQIGEIVQVIDDIADQTNLLALNAAIEAARAGEQGRGFAVVADEVRKLAERTTKATKEIADMIRQIQKDTGEAVVSMTKGTEEVQKGKELANRAGESLKQIIGATVKVVDDITQVATASEEQSSTAEQISKSIEAISNVTNETAAGIQQVARSAEDLNRLTDNLQDLINKFRVDGTARESHYSVRQNGKLVES